MAGVGGENLHLLMRGWRPLTPPCLHLLQTLDSQQESASMRAGVPFRLYHGSCPPPHIQHEPFVKGNAPGPLSARSLRNVRPPVGP